MGRFIIKIPFKVNPFEKRKTKIGI
jgi:hypothetical protein